MVETSFNSLTFNFQILSRLAIEIGFTIVQFNIYVFKFWIPELFKCLRWPCSNVVDCYISRSKEKTTMLWVMFGKCPEQLFNK